MKNLLTTVYCDFYTLLRKDEESAIQLCREPKNGNIKQTEKDLKTATALFKTQNYSGNNSKRNSLPQLKKSLGHSLQILTKNSKNLEWIASEDHNNIIHFDNRIINMSELSQDERIQIQDEIFNKITQQIKDEESTPGELKNKTKTIKNLASYRCKIKKFGDDFKYILEVENKLKKDKTLVTDKLRTQIIERLENSGVQRIEQKKKTVNKFLDLYNQMLEEKEIKAVNKAHSVMQESFIKIPHHNKIESIPASTYINVIKDFYTENFPEYNIEMIAFHANEITASTAKTGHHPHLFINCKNSKTNEYDFHNSVTKFINSQVDKNGFKFPETGELSREQLETRGQFLQEIFYKHANKYFNKHGVNIEFKEKTTEEMKFRKELDKNSKNNKSQRTYNLNNLLIKENNVLKHKKNELVSDVEVLKEEKENLLKKVSDLMESTLDFAAEYAATALKRALVNFKNEISLLSNLSKFVAKTVGKQAKVMQPTKEQEEEIENAIKDATKPPKQ